VVAWGDLRPKLPARWWAFPSGSRRCPQRSSVWQLREKRSGEPLHRAARGHVSAVRPSDGASLCVHRYACEVVGIPQRLENTSPLAPREVDRPILVVSADQYSRSELSTVTVAVVISNLRPASLPGNVMLPSELTGVEVDSVVNVTQISTIDRSALEQRVGVLPDWLMAQVDAGLERALSLGRAG